MGKKKFVVAMVTLLCVLLIYVFSNAISGNNPADNVDVWIGDEYYIAEVRHVIENFDEYYGKTIRIEGIFFEHGVDTIYRMVMRKDFSC